MSDNSGLPPLDAIKVNPKQSTGEIQASIPIDDGMGASSKDVIIGGGSLLILTLIFLFIRNSFVIYLVDNLRRSPNSSGLAGWGLFGGLLFGSAIGSLALTSKSFLTLAYIVPLAALSLVCFVLCFVAASKK